MTVGTLSDRRIAGCSRYPLLAIVAAKTVLDDPYARDRFARALRRAGLLAAPAAAPEPGLVDSEEPLDTSYPD